MSVPTVPGSEISVETPASTVKLDAGALSAGGRGKMAIAGAVAGLGEEFQQLSADLVKVRDARVAADADLRMRAAQHSFVQSTQGDEDESQWSERAAKTYETVREDIYANHKVSPSMRPQLDDQLKGWGQTLQIKAATMAAVQSVNRATVAVQKSFEEAGRDGDALGMANAVQLGRASKLDPVDMDRMEQSIPQTLARTAIEQGLAANPKGTYDLLMSGASLPVADQQGKPIVPQKVFSPKELESIQVRARTETNKWQTDNLVRMQSEDADPLTGFIPDDRIKAKIGTGEINAKAGNNLIASQARTVRAAATQQNREEFGLIETAIHDPTAWGEDPERYAQSLTDDAKKIADPVLRGRAINDANRQLAAVNVKRDNDRAALIKSDIMNRDAWGVDPDSHLSDLTAQVMNIGDPALRQKLINDAKTQLAAVKKTGELEEKPVERLIMGQMAEDRNQNDLTVPLTTEIKKGSRNIPDFWNRAPDEVTHARIEGGLSTLRNPEKLTDADIVAKFGDGATREGILRAEQLHFAQMQQKMRAWFKDPANANATYDDANKYRLQLERPFVFQAVGGALTPAADVTPAALETVRVKSPTGAVGTIPKSNLQKAKAAGYTEVK